MSIGLLLAATLLASPDSGEAHYQRGLDCFRTGQLECAIKAFSRAAEIEPSNARFWKLLGMAYAAAGNSEAAEAPFRKACELAPDDADAFYYLGRNDFVLSKFNSSVLDFERALEIDQRNWRVHRGLGLSLEAAGKIEGAEKHLRRAVKLSGSAARPDIDPRVDLGAFLFRRGRLRDALDPLEQALRDHPADARTRFEMGRSLFQLSRNDEAILHLAAAVELEPRNWPAHLLLGKAYFRAGRTDDGKKHTLIGHEGTMGDTYRSRTVR
ncbi:MAG: tetratricopeptide repeat protein [bacterium]|nr:tetratricopeptide repeat protein [bacterium]